MAKIRLASAFIVGIVLETWLYGIFFILFINSVWVQIAKARQNLPYNKVIFGALIYLFLSLTAHWIINVTRLYESTLQTVGGTAIDVYFSTTKGNVKYLVRIVLYESALLLGDCILVYRLYHVYEKNYWIILPNFITIPAMIVCDCMASYRSFNYNMGTPSYHKIVLPWITTLLSLTLFHNLYCCILICLRVYMMHRKSSNWLNTSLSRVLKIFIECAAPWILMFIATYLSWVAESTVEHALIDMTAPAVGISFCLIIVRFGANGGAAGRKSTETGLNTSANISFRHPVNITVTREEREDIELKHPYGARTHTSMRESSVLDMQDEPPQKVRSLSAMSPV